MLPSYPPVTLSWIPNRAQLIAKTCWQKVFRVASLDQLRYLRVELIPYQIGAVLCLLPSWRRLLCLLSLLCLRHNKCIDPMWKYTKWDWNPSACDCESSAQPLSYPSIHLYRTRLILCQRYIELSPPSACLFIMRLSCRLVRCSQSLCLRVPAQAASIEWM